MRPQLDTHPGHNPKIVDAIVQEWCEEFGIESFDDHISISGQVAPNTHMIKALTQAGLVLIDRFVAAGVLEGRQ